MGMIPRYFAMAGDYRSTAFGLAITGMGFGGFALAAATQAMIDAWGLPWALRVTGIVGGAVLSGASMLCVPAESWDEEGDAGPPCDPLSSAEAGPPVPDTGSTADTCGTLEEQVVAADPLNSTVTLHRATLPAASIETLPGLSSHYATLTRDQLKPASAPREHIPLRRLVFSTPFLLSCGFIFFLPFGSLGPATFGPSYARDVIGLDPTQAAHSVVVLNAGQILGSAASAAFAERIGGPATNVSFYVALSGLLMVAFWPFARTGALFLGYMALQGFANGAFNALVGNTVANNFDEASAAGAMSMAISFAAYGSLAGPEIQGAIVDAAGYLGMMAFSGAVMLVAAGFAWALRMHMSGGKWLAKV
ncbi:major facilitator superfamily domain-containing protein [Hyaloraphidium curvatum]|nr:major facilitator superfamily domain-containing protein [Hyaloraphidium curvatum]